MNLYLASRLSIQYLNAILYPNWNVLLNIIQDQADLIAPYHVVLSILRFAILFFRDAIRSIGIGNNMDMKVTIKAVGHLQYCFFLRCCIPTHQEMKGHYHACKALDDMKCSSFGCLTGRFFYIKNHLQLQLMDAEAMHSDNSLPPSSKC